MVNKKESRSLTIAIMSIFFLMNGIGAIAPGIQSIADAFPSIPFSTIFLVNTLPALFIIPSSFLAGAVAGSRMRYRTLVIGGIVLFVLGGAAPVILDNFAAILVSRIIFGIGAGLITPLGNALVLRFFAGQARANLLGAGNVFLNIGGILLQLTGGFLAAANWRYTFLSHLLGLISLVIVLVLLKEPEKVEQPAGKKVAMPKAVYFYSLLMLLMFLFIYPLMLSMSSIISEEGLGDASAAAVVLSMFTVGGAIAGLGFGEIFKYIKKYTLVFALVVVATGLFIFSKGERLVIITIGTTVVGAGLGLFLPAVIMDLGMVCPPESFAKASGTVLALSYAGDFLAPYYMTFIGAISGNSSLRFPLMVSCYAIAVEALIIFMLKMKSPVEGVLEKPPQ